MAIRVDNLIKKSVCILSSMNITALSRAGFKRAPIQYEIFNQYPPRFLLGRINEKKILSNANKRGRLRNEPLALYVHIPFCLRKCPFCCYFSMINWQARDIVRYLSYLEKEFSLLTHKVKINKRRITSVYAGGGTPALLSEAQVKRLVTALRNNFNIIKGAELTFEAAPETLTTKKLEVFFNSGFNRLSIGIQTFDDKILSFYKRLYSGREAVASFYRSRQAGFAHVNIDLLFGLKNQTLSSWAKTLHTAADLRAQSVTFYPFTDCFSRPVISAPAIYGRGVETQRLLMHLMAIELFIEAGYIQVTPYQFISSEEYLFVQQEHKAKNGEILAFGVTGHSFFNNVEYHNYSQMERYASSLDKLKLPVEAGRMLGRRELMIRFIVSGLQKTSGINREKGGVNKTVFYKQFGVSLEKTFKNEINKLETLGLIENGKIYMRLSHKGMLYPAETSRVFYLKKDKNRLTGIMKDLMRPIGLSG